MTNRAARAEAEAARQMSEDILTAALEAAGEALKTNRCSANLEASKMCWNARNKFIIPAKGRGGFACRAGQRQAAIARAEQAERNARRTFGGRWSMGGR